PLRGSRGRRAGAERRRKDGDDAGDAQASRQVQRQAAHRGRGAHAARASARELFHRELGEDCGRGRARVRLMASIYERPEHAQLQDTVARFLAGEVEPYGEKWEEQGFVPREVIRKLGRLGLLGITYPPEYGGAGADNVTAVAFQEALSRSPFGGFVF